MRQPPPNPISTSSFLNSLPLSIPHDANEACAICTFPWNATPDNDTVILPCHHNFHLQCITAWIDTPTKNQPASCPLCRTYLCQRPHQAAREELDAWLGWARSTAMKIIVDWSTPVWWQLMASEVAVADGVGEWWPTLIDACLDELYGPLAFVGPCGLQEFAVVKMVCVWLTVLGELSIMDVSGINAIYGVLDRYEDSVGMQTVRGVYESAGLGLLIDGEGDDGEVPNGDRVEGGGSDGEGFDSE